MGQRVRPARDTHIKHFSPPATKLAAAKEIGNMQSSENQHVHTSDDPPGLREWPELEPVRPSRQPPADILIEFDSPEVKSVMFTALNDDEAGFLEWIGADIDLSTWDGKTLRVRNGDDADYVYQTCLLNGLLVEFDDGTTMQLSPKAMAEVEGLITCIERLQADRRA